MEELIIQHLESMCDTTTPVKIVSIEQLGTDAFFVEFEFDECYNQGAVYFPQNDMLFTPSDWQGAEVTKETIEDFSWIDSAGDEAVVLHGLPRLFTAYRDDYRKEFGKKIRTLREEKGMTQEQLAKTAGLLRPNIARIESGRYNCTIDTIARLSAALGEKF